jgi:hypothetical protein
MLQITERYLVQFNDATSSSQRSEIGMMPLGFESRESGPPKPLPFDGSYSAMLAFLTLTL